MALSVGKLGIDLVGDDHDVVVLQHLGDGLQVPALHDAAGGVAGEGEHEGLGAWGDGRLQLLRGEAEAVLRRQLHIDGDAAGHLSERPVAHEGGHGDDDLVPGIHQDPDRQVDGLTAAHSDQDLVGVVVFQVKAAAEIVGDLPPQFQHTGIGGILGVAPLQRVDACVPDVPGGDKIGLTDAQGDGVCHLLQDIKKLADARGLDILDLLRNDLIVVHEKTNSLSCGSGRRNTRCFSLYFFKMKWVAVPVTPSRGARRSPTNWATSRRVRPEMMTVRSKAPLIR